MNDGSSKRRVVRFGPFEVNLQSGELRKSGVRVRLQEQPFRVLSVLLERPGEVVTREELRQRLWSEDTFVEFEQGLNAAVNRLRTALADSASDPRWIETLPRRGYRFLGTIEPLRAVKDAGPHVAPTSATKRERLAWLVATVFLAAFLTTALLLVWGPPAPRDATARRFSFTPESLTPAPPILGNFHRAKIAPNGRHIVLVVVRDGDTLLEVRDIDHEQPRELDGTNGAMTGPFWSPDSRFIVFAADGELKKIPVSGGAATVLCDLPRDTFAGGTWSPDGSLIAFSSGPGGTNLYKVSERGGQPTLLFPSANGVGNPRLLPSGAGPVVLFSSTSSEPEFWNIFLKNLESGEERIVARGRRAVYSATGHLLYEAGNPPDIWALPFSADALEATGEAFPVVDNGSEPSVASDGTLVFVDAPGVSRPARLVWRDRKGEKIANVDGSEHFISWPALSPDGQSVAFRGRRGHRAHIWVHDLGRSTSTRITSEGEAGFRPAWSPSGEQVIYDSGRDVWSSSSSGNGEAQAVARTSRDDITPDWSGDGKHVIYHVRDPETKRELWYVSRNEDGSWSEPIPFGTSREVEQTAKFSPDGRYVAYLTKGGIHLLGPHTTCCGRTSSSLHEPTVRYRIDLYSVSSRR